MPGTVNVTPLASELRVVLGRLMRRLRAEHRVPLTQAAVLGRLDRDGTQSIGDLAGAEQVRPQSMSQTLVELETDGLIIRRPDERDGRRILVELTAPRGMALRGDRRGILRAGAEGPGAGGHPAAPAQRDVSRAGTVSSAALAGGSVTR